MGLERPRFQRSAASPYRSARPSSTKLRLLQHADAYQGFTVKLSPRFSIIFLTIFVVMVAAFFLGAPRGAAQSDTDTATGTTLRVVMTELEPFIIDDDGDADGFYAEIWAEVASELGVNYNIIWVDSFPLLLEALDAGEADVAVAPLAPTAEREANFDFTSAVISSGPQLGYADRLVGGTSILQALLDARVLPLLLYAMIGVVAIGHLIWIVERNEDEDGPEDHFHSSYRTGLWDRVWWTMVTATTVGYGDRTPKSPLGRGIGLIVMALSLVLVGAFVSQMTTVLSESRAITPLRGVDDNDGRSVAVVEATSFEAYLLDLGVNTIGYQSQLEAFAAVANEEVDIVVANPSPCRRSAPSTASFQPATCSTKSSKPSV